MSNDNVSFGGHSLIHHPERWGPLLPRYAEPQPRKMLALDGGGIRGLITLGILKRLEQLLKAAHGNRPDFRLSGFFDYIAGTSTGAIIAACLARGMSVQEVIEFYTRVGPEMFAKARLDQRLVSFYTADPLVRLLQQVLNKEPDGSYDPHKPDKDLSPENLRCLLLVVTRNVTTDSPWPISSNPEARYNDPARPDCNLRVPLWKIVRASTAAPTFFPPEIVKWDPSDPLKTFMFVDGGVTPYNNPAFLLYRMATQPCYNLAWETGEKELLLVSIGTGSSASPSFRSNMNMLSNALTIPGTLMYGIQVDQDVNCRLLGRCTYGDLIDRELQDLTCRDIEPPYTRETWIAAKHTPLSKDLGRAFLYARYNADISASGLNDLGLSGIDAEKVQKMDAVDQIPNFLKIGDASGRQVDLAHFGSFVPAPSAIP